MKLRLNTESAFFAKRLLALITLSFILPIKEHLEKMYSKTT